MIYPTRLAVMVAAAGAPVALALAAAMPGRWVWALAWPVAVLMLVLLDALAARGTASLKLAMPRVAGVGEDFEAEAAVTMRGAGRPRRAELTLDEPAILGFADHGRIDVPLERGEGSGVLVACASARTALARAGQKIWACMAAYIYRRALRRAESKLMVLNARQHIAAVRSHFKRAATARASCGRGSA